MRILTLLLALPLSAQALPPLPDAAFFRGDPRQVMVACADRALALKAKDSRLMAE